MVQQLDLDKNVLVALTSVEKPSVKLPSIEELTKKYLDYTKQQVEAPKDEVSNEKLIDKLPMKGKIVKEQKNAQFGHDRLDTLQRDEGVSQEDRLHGG